MTKRCLLRIRYRLYSMTMKQYRLNATLNEIPGNPAPSSRTFWIHCLAAVAAFAAPSNVCYAQDITTILQSVIRRQQTGGVDGQPKYVTFQSFNVSGPKPLAAVNHEYVDGPGGRPGTPVYTVVTTFTVQSTYRDSLQYTQKPDQRFSCFVSVQNYWACNATKGTYNWKYWSAPNTRGASQYPAQNASQQTSITTPRPAPTARAPRPGVDPYSSIKQALASGPGRAGTITDLRVGSPRVYSGNEVPGVYIPRGSTGYPVTFGLAATGPYSNGAVFYKEFLCFPGTPQWSCQFVRSISR